MAFEFWLKVTVSPSVRLVRPVLCYHPKSASSTHYSIQAFGQRTVKKAPVKKAPVKKAPVARKVAPKKAPVTKNDGIPVLTKWRQNPDGSITGLVSNSKVFKKGQKWQLTAKGLAHLNLLTH